MRDVVHANGDRAAYRYPCFACSWLSGQARIGDDESATTVGRRQSGTQQRP